MEAETHNIIPPGEKREEGPLLNKMISWLGDGDLKNIYRKDDYTCSREQFQFLIGI